MNPKLVISPNFTIDDIHKIREYNYRITKNMTTEERTNFYRKGAESLEKEIQKKRSKKK